jgi:hypothetical protein
MTERTVATLAHRQVAEWDVTEARAPAPRDPPAADRLDQDFARHVLGVRVKLLG